MSVPLHEPVRLIEDDEWSSVLQSAATDGDSAALDRIASSLAAVGALTALPVAAKPAAWFTTTAGKIGIALSVASTGILIALVAAWSSSRAPMQPQAPPSPAPFAGTQQEVVQEPAEAAVLAPAPQAEGADLPNPQRSATPPEVRREASSSRESAENTSSFAEELAILQRMRSSTDPRQVLSLAEEHEARFPEGQLVVERQRLRRRAQEQLESPWWLGSPEQAPPEGAR